MDDGGFICFMVALGFVVLSVVGFLDYGSATGFLCLAIAGILVIIGLVIKLVNAISRRKKK